MCTTYVLLLALFHATKESCAFGRSTNCERRDVFAGSPIDALWLISGVCFLVFELLAAWRGPSASEFGLPHVIGVLVGTSLFALGTSLRCRAIAMLPEGFARPPFSGTPPSLVACGVFSVTRHPSELGLLLMCSGLVLIAADPQPLLFLIFCLVPLGALRIRREERWLRTVHGAVHVAYCGAVPLTLPRWSSYRNLLDVPGRA